MQPELFSQIKQTAINLLARRDYSRWELAQRLVKRYGASELIDTALDYLARLDYQSDARFARMYTRSRVSKQYGPERIRQELQQRHVDAALIEASLDAYAAQWLTLARALLKKKYRRPANAYAARQKQKHFLYYRGFTADQINAAFNDAAEVEFADS
jgi:regulatory protein